MISVDKTKKVMVNKKELAFDFVFPDPLVKPLVTPYGITFKK